MSDAVNNVGDSAQVHAKMLRHPFEGARPRSRASLDARRVPVFSKVQFANGFVTRARYFSAFVNALRDSTSHSILAALKRAQQPQLRPLAAADRLAFYVFGALLVRPLYNLLRLLSAQSLLGDIACFACSCVEAITFHGVSHVSGIGAPIKMRGINTQGRIAVVAAQLILRGPSVFMQREGQAMREKRKATLSASSVFNTTISAIRLLALPKPARVALAYIKETIKSLSHFAEGRFSDCLHGALNAIYQPNGHAATRQKGHTP